VHCVVEVIELSLCVNRRFRTGRPRMWITKISAWGL